MVLRFRSSTSHSEAKVVAPAATASSTSSPRTRVWLPDSALIGVALAAFSGISFSGGRGRTAEVSLLSVIFRYLACRYLSQMRYRLISEDGPECLDCHALRMAREV